MARRKIALVFLLLFFMVLLLSPWASAPMPSSPATADDTGEQQPSVLTSELFERPDNPLAPVDLQVAAALSPAEFETLRQQSGKQAYKFRDIRVSFVRIDPAAAFNAYVNASRVGEAADVMLMNNEWVKTFAVSGYLSPADSAFASDALSEQFDAISSPLKWNGYIWGVPRDFDPYVLVWNLGALYAITGADQADVPGRFPQWEELAAKNSSLESPLHWLAISGSDSLALLYWVQAAVGEAADIFREDSRGNPWEESPAAQALALLDTERAGVVFGKDPIEVTQSLLSGNTAAAIIPYSQAHQLIDLHPASGQVLTADLSAWQQPYIWPKGRSYTISSRTEADEAARRWIAALTESSVQSDNWTNNGKLPVYRSIYRDFEDERLGDLVSAGNAEAFPLAPLPSFGPDLPGRMAALNGLWQQFAAGSLHPQDWAERWSALSADAELDD